jgi:hypothetical protein
MIRRVARDSCGAIRAIRLTSATTSFENPMSDLLNRIREFDRHRPSFPGEHLIVAAVASCLLISAGRRRGVGRVLAVLAGGALLARAASGRDGLARLFER